MSGEDPFEESWAAWIKLTDGELVVASTDEELLERVLEGDPTAKVSRLDWSDREENDDG